MEQYGIRMAFFVNAGENGKKVLKWVVGKKWGVKVWVVNGGGANDIQP